MVTIINAQDNELSAEQTAAITEGAEWVSNWYRQRQESGNFTELPEYPEFEDVMSRAENVQVMVAGDMYTALEQALERGDLHFRDDVLSMFGDKETALEMLKKANQKKRETQAENNQVLGGLSVSNYVAEPVIVLNQGVLKNLSPEEITSIVVHETTHVAGANTSEQILGMIHGDMGGVTEEYIDTPKEMYARLMQVRQHFNLSPEAECTEEDVIRMREECVARREEFVKKNGQDVEIPEYIDFMMFDRYSDQEIQLLLNYTSDNTMQGAENGNVARALLADSMRRDAALCLAKERAFDRSTVIARREPVVAVPEHKMVEIDARFLARLNERQYS